MKPFKSSSLLCLLSFLKNSQSTNAKSHTWKIIAQKLLMEAKRKLGEILSAFEFLDDVAMDLVSLHGFYFPIHTKFSLLLSSFLQGLIFEK